MKPKKKVKVYDCSTGSVLEIDRDGYHGRGTKDIIRGQKFFLAVVGEQKLMSRNRLIAHPKLGGGWMDLTRGFQLAEAFCDLLM